MKKLSISIILALTAILSGCSSGSRLTSQQCRFPGTDSEAPGWVCNEPFVGWTVSASGSAKLTSAGPSLQRLTAMADARIQLARQVKVQVAGVVRQSVEAMCTGDAELLDRVSASVSKQIADQVLSGVRAIRSVTAPDGQLFMLLGLDDNALEELIRVAVKANC